MLQQRGCRLAGFDTPDLNAVQSAVTRSHSAVFTCCSYTPHNALLLLLLQSDYRLVVVSNSMQLLLLYSPQQTRSIIGLLLWFVPHNNTFSDHNS